MVKRSKGAFNGRTRKLKGKSIVTVAQIIRTFKVGDKVVVTPKARWDGMPHLRYTGRQGVILEKRGKAYMVEVRDYKVKKNIIVGAVHLTMAS
jgi:large subunit ribosomal protein L21e